LIRIEPVRRAMPTSRKLFPSYGSAAAQALCHAVERDGLVRNFVGGYANEFDRKAVAATAARVRELETTIGREALLAMIVEIREQLPRFFGKRRGAELDEAQAAAAAAFFEQFFDALGRVEHWSAEDAAEFDRDLELYSRMGPQRTTKGATPLRRGGKTAKAAETAAPADRFPFPDRCALLLDPSMMEKARRAADIFHGELVRAAGKILARTLGMRESR
jgi:hypothetical protein